MHGDQVGDPMSRDCLGVTVLRPPRVAVLSGMNGSRAHCAQVVIRREAAEVQTSHTMITNQLASGSAQARYHSHCAAVTSIR